MMGSTSTTISPSSRSFRRKTPCVEGCWGPMLRVMSWVCGAEPSGIVGLAKSTRLMRRPPGTEASHCSPHVASRVLGSLRSPRSLLLRLVGDVLALAHPDKLLRLLVVLPHGITGPVLRQEHAAQIGVALELDAVHVE